MIPFTMVRLAPIAALIAACGGCAIAPPTYPTITALPPKGKSLNEFQQDDYSCRAYASQTIDGSAGVANAGKAGLAAPAIGTAAGAAAGALIGAGAGNAGVGAAIGAGAGLVLGGLKGSQQHAQSEAGLQAQYNNVYAQCITAKGDTIATPGPRVLSPASTLIYVPSYYYVPY
ncbi:glycine zipper domain-containing protein [Paraburkholderia rhizosphaerae]|uniref:Outer membrane protein with glycine zipper n=1 Tax=Paraburkholderia rhizosphaerae TaxID=480658 RepID=A0A4R8LTE5_9BURK|nr:glycine zipper domain-containing protein [Paraburkholderia rhizosphaerae]TDY50980.1 outer membrane protein with glycine zipper [Paraburkholderia rhizosphaerae]